MKKWILQCKIVDLKQLDNKNVSINFFKLISFESALWFLEKDKKDRLIENKFKKKLFSKILAISFDGKNFIKLGKKIQIDLIEFWTPNYILKNILGNTIYFILSKPISIKKQFKLLDKLMQNINSISKADYQIYKQITYFIEKKNIFLITPHYHF